MPVYDFSAELTHLNGKFLSGFSAGLPTGIFIDEESYNKKMTLALLLEPILLYTVDRRDESPPDGEVHVLNEEQKINRFSLVLKIRDGGKIDITDRDVETIRNAITVLPTEPNGIVRMILTNSI